VISHTGFTQPKAGSRSDENDDAWSASADNLRFAVADGATESSFSGAWACLLAGSFTGGEGSLRQGREASTARAAWVSAQGAAWRSQLPKKLTWLAEEKAREGGHAAFLGLEFHHTPAGRLAWRAGAVGDCVLFTARGNTLTRAFPLFCPDGFPRRPDLVPTAPDVPTEWKLAGGLAAPGDVFLLSTDALAHYLAAQLFEEKPDWVSLAEQPDARSFTRAVEGLRRRGLVPNDDATLVRVSISGGPGEERG
jgi:hypothetical protein